MQIRFFLGQFDIFGLDVNAHTISSQLLRHLAGSATADKRIKNPVAFLGEQFDEPLRERARKRSAVASVVRFGG